MTYELPFWAHACSTDLGLDLGILPVDGAADDTATLLALYAAGHADVRVQDEAPDGVDPALMAGQGIVELRGHVAEGMEASPGNGGEVVVLVVETDVVSEPVQGTIVGESLGDGDAVIGVHLRGGDSLVDVVLGNEVAGKGVETSSKEGGDKEVEEGVGRSEADEGVVKGDLDDDVEEVDFGHGDAVDGHGAEGVEEDLEGAEEGLSEDRV